MSNSAKKTARALAEQSVVVVDETLDDSSADETTSGELGTVNSEIIVETLRQTNVKWKKAPNKIGYAGLSFIVAGVVFLLFVNFFLTRNSNQQITDGPFIPIINTSYVMATNILGIITLLLIFFTALRYIGIFKVFILLMTIAMIVLEWLFVKNNSDLGQFWNQGDLKFLHGFVWSGMIFALVGAIFLFIGRATQYNLVSNRYQANRVMISKLALITCYIGLILFAFFFIQDFSIYRREQSEYTNWYVGYLFIDLSIFIFLFLALVFQGYQSKVIFVTLIIGFGFICTIAGIFKHTLEHNEPGDSFSLDNFAMLFGMNSIYVPIAMLVLGFIVLLLPWRNVYQRRLSKAEKVVSSKQTTKEKKSVTKEKRLVKTETGERQMKEETMTIDSLSSATGASPKTSSSFEQVITEELTEIERIRIAQEAAAKAEEKAKEEGRILDEQTKAEAEKRAILVAENNKKIEALKAAAIAEQVKEAEQAKAVAEQKRIADEQRKQKSTEYISEVNRSVIVDESEQLSKQQLLSQQKVLEQANSTDIQRLLDQQRVAEELVLQSKLQPQQNYQPVEAKSTKTTTQSTFSMTGDYRYPSDIPDEVVGANENMTPRQIEVLKEKYFINYRNAKELEEKKQLIETQKVEQERTDAQRRFEELMKRLSDLEDKNKTLEVNNQQLQQSLASREADFVNKINEITQRSQVDSKSVIEEATKKIQEAQVLQKTSQQSEEATRIAEQSKMQVQEALSKIQEQMNELRQAQIASKQASQFNEVNVAKSQEEKLNQKQEEFLKETQRMMAEQQAELQRQFREAQQVIEAQRNAADSQRTAAENQRIAIETAQTRAALEAARQASAQASAAQKAAEQAKANQYTVQGQPIPPTQYYQQQPFQVQYPVQGPVVQQPQPAPQYIAPVPPGQYPPGQYPAQYPYPTNYDPYAYRRPGYGNTHYYEDIGDDHTKLRMELDAQRRILLNLQSKLNGGPEESRVVRRGRNSTSQVIYEPEETEIVVKRAPKQRRIVIDEDEDDSRPSRSESNRLVNQMLAEVDAEFGTSPRKRRIERYEADNQTNRKTTVIDQGTTTFIKPSIDADDDDNDEYD